MNFEQSQIDPEIPSFRFSEEEKENMRDGGMSEEEIEAKEKEISGRIADRKKEEIKKDFDEAA